MKTLCAYCYAFLLALVLTRCGPAGNPVDSQRVVVYTSVDRIFSEPVLQRAAQILDVDVIGVYDTEETKSTGLVNRLIAKKENPDGDLFWSGDPARAALLKVEGITAAYDSPAAAPIPDAFKDPDRHWIGFSARTRVLLANTDLVSAGEEPKNIFDLTQAKWKGQVAIANPLFGTTSFHMAALVQALGEEEAFRWLDNLRANGVRLVSSNGEVKRQVASGSVAVGLTDSDDAAEAMADGQPVRAILLDQAREPAPPLGNLVIPNTVSLIEGGPNPEDARKVFDFLLSAETQALLAASCAQAPLDPAVAVPDNVVSLGGLVPMKVDYATCAEVLQRIMTRLDTWVNQG
ncbi:MAG: extracellular solute-binding protein [Candidatus Hydrogenedentes bacterium]|jgi:iron(III) transport system substrate-binding protein|nr:extracellular solute-binding protein [Candidatus Hydrogenedentota bacterium]